MLFHTSRSDRKILDRVLRKKKSVPLVMVVSANFVCGLRSPAVWSESPCEHGEVVQVQDVGAWVSCLILRLWSLPDRACLSCGVIHVDFLWCTYDSVHTCHRIVRAAVFLHALTVICLFSQSTCTTCEFLLLCLSEVMLCGLASLAFRSERCCMASCPSLSPLQTGQANHHLFKRFLSTCLLFCL